MKKPEKSGKKTGEIADEKLDKVSGGNLSADFATTATMAGGIDATLNQPSLKIPTKRILVP